MNITKAYVINLPHRTDRWSQIQSSFKNTNIQLIQWPATNGKQLTEESINSQTTQFCQNFCSTGMIGCYLSHYKLWQHIVSNNETNVLILEDDAKPIPNFQTKFKEVTQELPPDYDLFYL